MAKDPRSLTEQVYKEEAARVLAALMGMTRDLELAQDALHDALAEALEQWTVQGTPANPGAWLLTVARRRAIDRIRRDAVWGHKVALDDTVATLSEPEAEETMLSSIPDKRLQLIFTCCHPSIALDAQVALTLHTLGGLSTPEVANAFLVPVPTMFQRLTRAKRKIKEAGIPYRIPPDHVLPERLNAVLAVIYLIFNEGYAASMGETHVRQHLCHEAIRLGRILANLMPDEPEVLGLLALMVLHDARRLARLSEAGELLVLEAQDRTRWDQAQIREGLDLLEHVLRWRRPGPYQLQAAISALHAQAPCFEATDWRQIAALYGRLYRLQPSPVIELNQAVAIALAGNLEAALAVMRRLETSGVLKDYHYLPAARADLLRRAGRLAEARVDYEAALQLVHNEAERRYLARRLTEL